MAKRKRYPIGMQTFEELIENDCLYVDKTEYVYNMTHSDPKYIFLSRPRRFGKSLLVTTLRAYFEGRKELFKGLAIEKLENDWTGYPVIHLDMSGGKHKTKDALERYLLEVLKDNADRLGVNIEAQDTNIALKQLITESRKKYGRKVVILLDEYDAPLLDVVHDAKALDTLRGVMRNFYSPIKMCDSDIHFGFITGITKFSQLSIFSELNNLANISMSPNYAGICGITEDEIWQQMQEGIQELAAAQQLTQDEAVASLKENYDGYHFSWPSPDIYNPFSLLLALSNRNIGAYWFGTGTPTFLIEMLKKFNVIPSDLSSSFKAKASEFDAPTESMEAITPMLYQSGYITIKSKNKFGVYTLCLPNNEIRLGLMESLLPHYLPPTVRGTGATVGEMQEALYNDDIDAMFKALQKFLKTIPKVNNVEKPEHFEAHWQQMLFIFFSLLGAYCAVEVKTGGGNIDIVARTSKALYLIELKVNKKADVAINQIDLNEYDAHFALCNLPVVKVGVNFSEEKRNITDWEIG